MGCHSLITPQVVGIIIGLIAVIVSIGLGIPPVLALVVGIIFGVVAFFILNDAKKEY
jgi:putative flippase GtrA